MMSDLFMTVVSHKRIIILIYCESYEYVQIEVNRK